MYHRQATISLHHAAPADAFALSVICVGSRHAVVVSLAKKRRVVCCDVPDCSLYSATCSVRKYCHSYKTSLYFIQPSTVTQQDCSSSSTLLSLLHCRQRARYRAVRDWCAAGQSGTAAGTAHRRPRPPRQRLQSPRRRAPRGRRPRKGQAVPAAQRAE